MLAACDEVVVLMLDGWDESAGVREEVRLARGFGKPVRYLAPCGSNETPTFANVATSSPGCAIRRQ